MAEDGERGSGVGYAGLLAGCGEGEDSPPRSNPTTNATPGPRLAASSTKARCGTAAEQTAGRRCTPLYTISPCFWPFCTAPLPRLEICCTCGTSLVRHCNHLLAIPAGKTHNG